jgi:hypothetical protein
MPVVMNKLYSITGNYTPEQIEILKGYIDTFRLRVKDYDPDKNILIGKKLEFTDNEIIALIKTSLSDINSGYPRSNYTLFDFTALIDVDTVMDGAVIFSLMGDGILQLRNQIDYSDSGLTIAMFNKTTLYQSWMGLLLQDYMRAKAAVKAAILPTSENSGFVGMGSEYSYRLWW